MYDIFVKGGPLMWPILFCSLVSLTISVERGLFWWRRDRRRNDKLIEDILSHTGRGDLNAALSIGNNTPAPVARVLVSGLVHRDYGLRESMEAAAVNEIECMKRGLNIMDTIITMAPLLGILGTVLGIIESFDLLGMSGIEDPKAVTGGIARALITTAAGLSVAIITLMPFNYFAAKVQKATRYLENITSRFEVACKKGQGGNNAA